MADALGSDAVAGVEVRDSARRVWRLTAGRDARRGRFVVLRPVRGDNEPFRASADGFRPDVYLPISGDEWDLLARLAAGAGGGADAGADAGGGREAEALRNDAFRLVDRMVVDAHHRQLMGAADDEDDA
jgi:hypothetical protein